MVLPTTVSRVALLAASAVLLFLAVRIYRRQDRPVGRSFSALLALLGGTAFCLSITAATGAPNKLIWLFTNLSIPLALLAFSVSYYGIELFSSRSRTAAIFAPAVFAFVGGSVLILGTPTKIMSSEPPVAAVAALPAAVFDIATTFDRIGYYYTVGLVVVSVGLVARNVFRYDHLDTRLAALVAFMGAWPWLGNFLVPELDAIYSPAISLTLLAFGYSSSAVLAALAVGPFGLFDSSPAAGNVGPGRVLDSMDEPVLITDDQNQLLRINRVACETFNLGETTAIGRPLSAVLGHDLPDDTGPVALETVDGIRQFRISRSAITDSRDFERGTVFIFRDVTQKQSREQRLEVLNRVLRHNLRNNATSIIGRAQLISNGQADEQSAEQIIETTQNLVGVAESARDIENMMAATGNDETSPVGGVVEKVLDDIEPAHPETTLTTAIPDDVIAAVSPTALETVLAQLVENAVEHNDADEPLVVVSADRTDSDSLTIAISDNGPGIPAHEREVIEAGAEDQLQHGSGLGLWAVQWGVTQMGGQLSIADNEPRGTTVTITVPAVESAATSIEESDQSEIPA